jgi:hypothetical protein
MDEVFQSAFEDGRVRDRLGELGQKMLSTNRRRFTSGSLIMSSEFGALIFGMP